MGRLRQTGVTMLETEVACGGATHVVRLCGDRLLLVDHADDRGADDAFLALLGRAARCREVEDAWQHLDSTRALELLTLSAEELDAKAMRLPVAVSERERLRKRDDLTPEQMAVAIHGFDRVVHQSLVASLGPAFARRRALMALHGASRPTARRTLGRAAADTTGAAGWHVVVGPRWLPGATARVRRHAVGVVSERWARRHYAPESRLAG